MLRNEIDNNEKDILAEQKFADFLNNFLTQEEYNTIISIDKERWYFFNNNLPLLHYFIHRGANLEQLITVNIKLLEKCSSLFSEEKMNLILANIAVADFFRIESDYLSNLFPENLSILLTHGLKIEQLQNQSIPLKKCLSHPHLKDILQFVTLQQILGTDLTPLPINQLIADNQLTSPSKTINHFGEGKIDNFVFEYSEEGINIIEYANQKEIAFFNIAFITKPEILAKISNKITNTPTTRIKLIHEWYIIEEKLETDLAVRKNIFFSPDLQYLMYENYTANFSKEKLIATPILSISPYYEEIAFVNFLKDQGEPIESLLNFPGMTTSKLNLLCHYQDIVADMIQYQANLADFALASETRLQYIFAHYNKAYHALTVVPATKLLGLSFIGLQTAALFSQHKNKTRITNTEENKPNTYSQCIIS